MVVLIISIIIKALPIVLLLAVFIFVIWSVVPIKNSDINNEINKRVEEKREELEKAIAKNVSLDEEIEVTQSLVDAEVSVFKKSQKLNKIENGERL